MPTQAMEAEFQKLTGSDYTRFAGSFQLVEKKVDGEGRTYIEGFVSGAGNSAIIMYDGRNHIWAAVTAENINYYTNTYDGKKMPKAIEEWIARFEGRVEIQ